MSSYLRLVPLLDWDPPQTKRGVIGKKIQSKAQCELAYRKSKINSEERRREESKGSNRQEKGRRLGRTCRLRLLSPL